VAGECADPLLDTGEDTPTGGRLHRAAELLDGERFCLAYADAVADVDLGALIDRHERHSGDATMTVVRPRLPFGVARLSADGERVAGFDEKPVSERWINAGFFCLEPTVLTLLGPDAVLEREPLSALARMGRLAAHRHEGFWHCVDTPKDAVALNAAYEADPARAPWLGGPAPVPG
jgi:glucose-1-phosphate cytidylyltransferase